MNEQSNTCTDIVNEQSNTCTDIVNGSQWLRTMAAHIERATLAARFAGRMHETTAEWFSARDAAREAEDVAISALAQAAGRMTRDSAAAGALQRNGWAWQPAGATWVAPPPPALPPADPKPAAAVAQLEALGWRWSFWRPGESAHWVEPVPGKIDLRNVKAAKTLEAEGYVWNGGTQRWVCQKAAKPAVDPARYSAVCHAARRAVTAARHGVGAQAAIQALQDALEDNDPSGWDAEALRDAAEILVVATMRAGIKLGGEVGEALERLAAALQRQQ